MYLTLKRSIMDSAASIVPPWRHINPYRERGPHGARRKKPLARNRKGPAPNRSCGKREKIRRATCDVIRAEQAALKWRGDGLVDRITLHDLRRARRGAINRAKAPAVLKEYEAAVDRLNRAVSA